MFFSYIVGVDLGQAADPTAICILEEASWVPAELRDQRGNILALADESRWAWPSETPAATIEAARRLDVIRTRPSKPPLRVPHLERIPLGTSYLEIVRYAKQLVERPPIADVRHALLIDYGGVGRGVFDSFEDQGLRPYGISITSGEQVNQDEVGWRVPKRELVAYAQMVLQSGRLKITTPSPDAAVLRDELKNYRVKVSKAGNDLYEPYRSGQHDDLLMAFALCCWLVE